MDRGFEIISRKGAEQFRVLVFDRKRRLHFPLTVFAAETVKCSSDSTARVYLSALIPFFEWLESQCGTVRSWDEPPEAIRQGVGDYLVERLKCKVREHHAGFQLVSLTDGAQTTVRVFLSALKLFYRVMRAQDRYRYDNALVDSPSALLAEVKDRIAGAALLPRMPEVSGVVHPRKRRLSDSYFKLVGETWIPQVIDDPEFPARVLRGGQSVGWQLQEQCITRILFESGCRVSEAVGLNLRDWAARGFLQEAQAFSKGSHGRRVKFIRFSAATAKLLRRFFDTERRHVDRIHYGLADYIREAQEHGTDLYHVPLFLCRRGTQLTPKAFREGCWNPVCLAIRIEADIHQTRHWYVTQAIRSIYESARSESEIDRRLRELIEYMGWKSGWETLQAYQHYFDPQRHAEVQDQLYQRMDQALKGHLAQPSRHSAVTALSGAVLQAENAGRSIHDGERDSDLEYLLALGGGRGIPGDGE